ncbi:MAG: DUF447 family protein [Promethearchaeota archaeon]|nr:MAG: DUF447 family protein [Candidatus Lokiarchaeota archaeon]
MKTIFIVICVIFEEFGMYKESYYETIAATISFKDEAKIPNAASIGIRIIDDDLISVKSYLQTQTYHNVKKNKVLSFNLIEDVYQFALSSLKNENNGDLRGILKDQFLYQNFTSENQVFEIPYLKNAWGVIFCKLIYQREIKNKDYLGKIEACEFQFKVIETKRLKESFKIFNRAENLALEVIILVTRMKVAKENNNQIIYSEINDKIQDYINTIEKLSKKDSILKTIEHIRKYLKSL